MTTQYDEPTFNLKVVVRETGLKPDTLRVWERRYGLPSPDRTQGGHRLYSERDIDTVKWLMARRAEGLSIGRAADLWHRLEADGQDPLVGEATAPGAVGGPPLAAGAPNVVELRRAWVVACMAFDEARADQILTQAFSILPPETVTVEILQAGLARIGDGWYQGGVSVQQEHFASSLAMRRIDALILAAPPPNRAGRILVACPAEEQHVFAPLLLTFLLRRRGLDVLFLGANVPQDRLEGALEAARPRLAILSAQQLHTAATLAEMADLLQRGGVPVAYGGLIFNRIPAVRERIRGAFLGESLPEAVERAERFLASPPRAERVEPAGNEGALPHYLAQRPLIERELEGGMSVHGMTSAALMAANGGMAHALSAALSLGDINLILPDMDWVAGLLRGRGLPTSQLGHYLAAYGAAAASHLDARGQPIVDWFQQIQGGQQT